MAGFLWALAPQGEAAPPQAGRLPTPSLPAFTLPSLLLFFCSLYLGAQPGLSGPSSVAVEHCLTPPCRMGPLCLSHLRTSALFLQTWAIWVPASRAPIPAHLTKDEGHTPVCTEGTPHTQPSASSPRPRTTAKSQSGDPRECEGRAGS